jgi:uncharacterized protein (TIGR02118 family)
MAMLMVTYGMPKDAAAFDRYYHDIHVPMTKKVPGLRKYQISRGPVQTPSGPSSCYMVAVLYFDDMTAIQRAFSSPEGQAAAADVAVFASGGAEILMFDTKDL